MTRGIVALAGVVVILAGVKAASSIIVPFLFAGFLAVTLARPFLAMRERGIPSAIALLVMIMALVALGMAIATIIRPSIDGFVVSLPAYQENLRLQLSEVWRWIEAMGGDAPRAFVADYINPQAGIRYLGNAGRQLSGLLGWSFIILIIVAFMLVEADRLNQKIQTIADSNQTDVAAVTNTIREVRRYVSLKTLISVLTGAAVTAWLWFLDVDHALFMGLLAFFLNFVPAVGSIIAAIPGVLLAFIIGGPDLAGLAFLGYFVINTALSNVLEPRLMGHSMDISPLVVALSLLFWGWMLGPVGMLLAVPLTMVVKVALEANEGTRAIALLMGSGRPQTPQPSSEPEKR
ncbi:MAG: AI-2E family transporter [Alphaproteobacteria bacterium]|nr:AI-2E family transporter [Alphaproteobacteria bacterium]